MSIYREIEKITIQGEELDYIKPGLAQMAGIMQWLAQGLAPTFLTKDQLDNLTSMQIFEECINYVSALNTNNVSEDEKNGLFGAALVTSKATIDYLYPAVKQCFPTVELERVTDTALNEILSVFLTDYFSLITS